jgi:hypothetical protein
VSPPLVNSVLGDKTTFLLSSSYHLFCGCLSVCAYLGCCRCNCALPSLYSERLVFAVYTLLARVRQAWGCFFFLWLTLLFNTKHDRIGFFFFCVWLSAVDKVDEPHKPNLARVLTGHNK